PRPRHIPSHEAMQVATGQTAKREAREFLRERLEAGPAKQEDIVEDAKQNGIAIATLRRAKKDLGVKSRKEKKIDGDWFWELPPQRVPPREREIVHLQLIFPMSGV